jgi:hypothetical protein
VLTAADTAIQVVELAITILQRGDPAPEAEVNAGFSVNGNLDLDQLHELVSKAAGRPVGKITMGSVVTAGVFRL